jgi:hypothetical protein
MDRTNHTNRQLRKLINSKKLLKALGLFSLYTQKRVIQNVYNNNPNNQSSRIWSTWLTNHNINHNISNKLR